MAYKDFSLGSDLGANATPNATTLVIEGPTVSLPDASFVRDATITREGIDLVLEGPDGTIIIEGYFAAEPAPSLVAPGGETLTPQLVDSFLQSNPEYAANQTANDASPVGIAQEVTGEATVTRTDGSVVPLTKGTPIFEGDIIQTAENGAVNIVFIDQTSFAIAEDAKLAIDKYVFDPETQAGTTDFSILKGMFVFTSGMIGREDPDDVKIETPAGSIGIRGTIIAGNVDTGEITVVEGAIVLRDFQGNEVTLANQFETARFDPSGGNIQPLGTISANDVGSRFGALSAVTPSFFSNVQQNIPTESNNNTTDAVPDANSDTAPDAAPDASTAPTADDTTPAPVAPVNPGGTGFGPPPGSFTSGSGGFTSPTTPGATNSGPLPPPGGFAPPPVGTAPNTPPPQFQPLVPPPIDPNVINQQPANRAPIFDTQTVPEYFRATEGQAWNYHFDKEFRDLDIPRGDSLTFLLSTQTVNDLNAWQTTANGNILNSWSFNTINGQLQLFFNSGFTTPSVPGTISNLTIQIQAIDESGASSGIQNYTFQAYDPTGTVGTTITNFSPDNAIISGPPSGASIGTIIGDGNSFFFNNGNEIITLDNTSGPNTGSSNYINLGNGQNTITVENDAFNNTIVGGNNRDTFVLRNARVEAYGGDNDDEFVLDFSNGPNIIGELQTASSNTNIEGGHSNFRAGDILRNNFNVPVFGGLGGRGDTLALSGVGSLDFSTIDPNNHITGIERIDAATSTSAQTITLRYQDLLELTGRANNTALIINLGVGDTLNLAGPGFNLSKMNKIADDFVIDDGLQGNVQNRDYDIYSDGNVTVLIHDQSSGAAIVNFDGTNVTV